VEPLEEMIAFAAKRTGGLHFLLVVAMTTGMKQNTVAETHHKMYVAFVLLGGTSDVWYNAGLLTAHRST
jgi:hypothetical protein